jgi:molecular chaperone DnaK
MVLTRARFEELVRALIDRTTAFCEKALKDAKLTPQDISKVILVGGQTRTPAVARHVAKIFGKEPSLEVNPDEVVAVGAALQGGVLKGDLKEIVLLDVLPLSLGVETQGGLFTGIIEHNSTIPLKKTTIFTTVADNQTVVEIHVLQGERDVARFNRSLAKFDLVGIAPSPRGAPQIEVAFDMDANGILSVSAKDTLSGKAQAVRITPSTGLSKDEIDRMILEAKQFAEDDRKTRETTELRNRIKGQLTALARSYSGCGWLLGAVEQEMAKDAIQRARDLDPAEGSLTLLRDLMTQLENAAESLAAVMLNSPGDMEMQPDGMRARDKEPDANQLMKSALKDMDEQ